MDKIDETMAIKSLRRCFNIYGIEGTEQRIKELFGHMKGMYEFHMKIYNKLLRG